MAEAQKLQVLSTQDGTTIVLPEQEADFSFRRGDSVKRVFSAIAAGFAALCIGLPWLLLSGVNLSRKPRYWQGQTLDYLLAGFAIGVVVALIALAWFVAGVVVLQFWPAHDQFEVKPDLLIARRRQGFWHRTRRVGGITTISISPPRSIARDWADRRLGKKTGRLMVETSDGRRVWLTETRPYPLIREVADAMVQAVSHAKWPRPPVLVDMVDDRTRQSDHGTPPAGVAYHVSHGDVAHGDEVGVMAIAPLRTAGVLAMLLRSGIFRAGVLCVVLPYPLCIWMAHTWPEEAGTMGPVASRVALILLIPGAMLSAAMWYAVAREQRYLISREHLIQVNDLRLWRWCKRWERKEIAAIRIVPHSGDRGRYSDRLELLQKDGRSVALESGDLQRLQYLATLLRRELAVGADAPVPAVDARVELVPPDTCPFTVNEGEQTLEITHPAQGWTRSAIAAATMGILSILAAAIGPILAWSHLKDDERSPLVLLALLFGGMGIAVVLAALYERSLCWRLYLDRNGLAWSKVSVFGRKQGQWTCDQVGQITARAMFPDNPKSPVRLCVVDRNGESTVLMSDSAKATGYLAALLHRRFAQYG